MHLTRKHCRDASTVRLLHRLAPRTLRRTNPDSQLAHSGLDPPHLDNPMAPTAGRKAERRDASNRNKKDSEGREATDAPEAPARPVFFPSRRTRQRFGFAPCGPPPCAVRDARGHPSLWLPQLRAVPGPGGLVLDDGPRAQKVGQKALLSLGHAAILLQDRPPPPAPTAGAPPFHRESRVTSPRRADLGNLPDICSSLACMANLKDLRRNAAVRRRLGGRPETKKGPPAPRPGKPAGGPGKEPV